MASVPPQPRDARLISGKARCSYGACRGVLGEVIHARQPDDGRRFPGCPDRPATGYVVMLYLPPGFTWDGAVWRLGNAAAVRTGARAAPAGRVANPTRYSRESPALRYPSHDAPHIPLPVTQDELRAEVSLVWRDALGGPPVANVITPRDLATIRNQAPLPALVACPQCGHVLRVRCDG